MANCSVWEHYQPAAENAPQPSVDDLVREAKRLAAWFDDIKSRQKDVSVESTPALKGVAKLTNDKSWKSNDPLEVATTPPLISRRLTTYAARAADAPAALARKSPSIPVKTALLALKFGINASPYWLIDAIGVAAFSLWRSRRASPKRAPRWLSSPTESRGLAAPVALSGLRYVLMGPKTSGARMDVRLSVGKSTHQYI
jgi:hypothetical protein